MSSQIVLKITLASMLFLTHLALQSMSDSSLEHYFTGKCVNRHGMFPTTKCSKYLNCGEEGHANIKDCNITQPGTIFNISSRQCVEDTTPPCKDVDKVNVFEWTNLTKQNRETLENGKMPMPATKNEQKERLDDVNKHWNKDFDVLLKTSFLAVNDGPYAFYSKCVPWCKVWIRKDICGTPELVIHQKIRGRSRSKVEYYVQKNYTMEFAKLYYITVVHMGLSTDEFQFLIGVKIPGENDKAEKNIPPALLRLPEEKKCPQSSTKKTTSIHPSPSTISVAGSLTSNRTIRNTRSSTPNITISNTGILAPSSTKFLASTTKLRVLPSLISSQSESGLPSAITQTSAVIKPTPSQQGTTESSSTTTTSPKLHIEGLSKITDKFLNTTTNNSSPDNQLDGMLQAKDVDLEGQIIAESWNERGKSLKVYRKNVVMEVGFPLSNYTFQARNITNKIKNLNIDQIFIPVTALITKEGEFKRKVFSALYYNLNKKIPQFFNVVETETKQIPGSYQLNSHLIASTAVPKISGLPSYDIVIRLVHLQRNFSREVKPLCVFFKWSNDINSDGVWSTEGCILDENLSNQNVSVCRCNHLTHFGVLMKVDTHQLGAKDAKALKIITYIGCALSLVGVSLTVLAIICLPGARSDRNFIHVNLAVAIGLAQVTFLAGVDETGYEIVCTLVAAMLHYFLLVAFAWMLIEGIFLHILIVKVFHDHLPKKRFYVTFCWGLPLVIVLLSVGLLRDGYGTKTSCWLSTDKSTIWTFSGPAILVMIINIIILCKVMKEISSLRTSDRQDSNVRSVRYGVRSTIILLPLLGLTWAFGLICVNDSLAVFQYLFTIFNSLQGLFIFLFHCVFNTEVRKAFWRKVDIWFTNHNNPFANNVHSSFKKCKDDPSSIISPDNDNQGPQRGVSMYSFNDLTERERRKFSTATASTCLDPWPHKLSLTPSMDGPFPSRFTPSLSSDDVKYQPIYKLDPGQKRISSKSMKIKVEDLNGNTTKLDSDCGLTEESDQALGNKDSQNEANITQNYEETSLVKIRQPNQQDAELQEKQNTNLDQQTTDQNSGKNIEDNKSSEESYIQKEPRHDYKEKSDQNERTEKQQNWNLSKKSPRESPGEKQTAGIGGQRVNSADSKGHVIKMDVNNTFGSLGTKL